MSARPLIDSLDFARNGKEISAEIPFAGMPRLLEELDSPDGVLHYTVRGGEDKLGVSFLDVSMTGDCQLRCQRCLSALEYPIRISTRLLLRDQAELDALDDDEEEFDSILADARLDVLNLLEEEILLSLPIAPRHELGTCQPTGVEDRHGAEESPFAVLGKLKRGV